MIKKIAMIALVTPLLLTSCALHSGLTTNENQHATQVVLAQDNFKVVKSVTGEAQVTYVFGIGGNSKKALIAHARTQMLKEANLEGSSRAIINETVEIRGTNFPLFGKKLVVVSAQVIEFTK